MTTKHATKGIPEVYECEVNKIVDECCRLKRDLGLPLKTIVAVDERAETGFFRILYVFADAGKREFIAPFIRVKDEFPSLTPRIHEASHYERRIMTMFGLVPVGHPEPRTLILHENWPVGVYPLRKDFDIHERPTKGGLPFSFRRIDGSGIYEIPVGPVHAGIIEPGHFRFSVAGEEILMLEPRLGYCHKGTEKLFETLPRAELVRLSERVSGDSSFSHALAFCEAMEAASGTDVPERAKYLRVLFAELERMANHFGDIGAIMLDTGFNFGGAQGARLREMIMRINERLTGSRFLRGVNTVGGVTKDVSDEELKSVAHEISAIVADFNEVMAVAEISSSLQGRLHGTGILDKTVAADHGALGVAGRAVGFSMDARRDFPYAAYGKLNVHVVSETDGDVYARFMVRVREVRNSADIIRQVVRDIPDHGQVFEKPHELKKDHCAIGMVEGWRGDIVYTIITDRKGEIARVDVRDPSFLNWTVLGHAGVGNMVPDFPLINKSFNLSYTGNDL